MSVRKYASKSIAAFSKRKYPFLVLVVSSKKCRLFKYESDVYTRINDGPESIAEATTDAPQRISNFSDPAAHKQATVQKFLHRIDEGLGDILNKNKLPVFLLAPQKIIGHFRKTSKHNKSIIGHIHGNFDDITLARLKQIMKPYADRMAFLAGKSFAE